MKIFLPFKQDLNPYLEEISKYSVHEFVYDSWKSYKTSYPVVNIHWPEALFDWHEPTTNELLELEKEIKLWREHSVIVYTKHDFERNKGTTPMFTKLFEIIEKNSDAFIHLGNFSRKHYQTIYPKVKHFLLNHPLYFNSYGKEQINTEKARELLNIEKDSKVIIVPGNIRSEREKSLVLRSFRKVNHKNKVLIAINMRAELINDFRGRTRLKKVFDYQKYIVNRFKRKHRPPQFIFTYDKIDNHMLALKMAAADVVLIPRMKALNSGILFLGLTFGKVVTGPASGNIQEQLEKMEYPVFNPAKILSVKNALEKAILISSENKAISPEALQEYWPSTIAEKMDSILHELATNRVELPKK